MAIKKNTHNVSDPGQYNPLIADQKKRVGQYPDDAREWLELGRLQRAKKDLTNCLAKRSPGIRYAFALYIGLVGPLSAFAIRNISNLHLPTWLYISFLSAILFLVIIGSYWIWYLRYPPSGRKYFKKAIRLDPDCGEAYMHLGMIALSRYQKRKACRFLEQAVTLKYNNSKIERELKSVYEKEFMTFFSRKTEKEVKLQESIDSQLEQIRELHSTTASLEGLTENLTDRVEQAKWETGHKAKTLNREMSDRIAAIRKDYEEQIAAIKQDKESQEEAKESAERQFVRLTTEIMEAKAELEVRSLKDSAKTVENIMGTRLWQTLSEQTKTFLATAEQIYSVLIKQEEKPDYSLVGMQLCKALETELNQTLVEPFVRNLNGNKDRFLRINQTGTSKGRPVYFSYLAKIIDRKNYPEVTSLTLGQYHFTLKHTFAREYALKEYGNFLAKMYATSEAIFGKTFLKNLETVTKTYRNTIAHCSSMNKKQYDHLRALIFAEKEALLVTCCRFGVETT